MWDGDQSEWCLAVTVNLDVQKDTLSAEIPDLIFKSLYTLLDCNILEVCTCRNVLLFFVYEMIKKEHVVWPDALFHLFFDLCSSALRMASILQKLITPLFSGPPEPPRNKVTVVGVGQVGMACAISILLRVRVLMFMPLLRLPSYLLLSQYGVIPRILLEWHRITDLLASDLNLIHSLSVLKRKHVKAIKRDHFCWNLTKAVQPPTF